MRSYKFTYLLFHLILAFILLPSCEPQTNAVSPKTETSNSSIKLPSESNVESGQSAEDPATKRMGVSQRDSSTVTLKDAVTKPTTVDSSNLATFKTEAGEKAPKIGDEIYQMINLPSDRCGEFWVQDSDGTVRKIAVCTGDHADGHHH